MSLIVPLHFLFFLTGVVATAQHFFFLHADTIPCNCKGYYSINANTKDTVEFFQVNSSGRTITRNELRKSGFRIDSIKYNNFSKIKEYKITIGFENNLSIYIKLFEYSNYGILIKVIDSSYQILYSRIYASSRETQYFYDSKGRPKTIVGGTDTISFKQVNDSTYTIRYKDDNVLKKGKRIYNKRNQVIDEILENPATGRIVQYKFKYNSKGQLLNATQVKIMKGTVGFFGSEFHDLFPGTTKLVYQYDSKSRRIKRVMDDYVLLYHYF